DHVPHVTDAKYRSFSLVVDPPRRRSRKCKLAISTSAPICIAQGRYLLSQSSQRAPHDRQRRRPTRSMPSLAITHLACRTQIPIGPAAPPRPTSHGFLPWRLSDDGPRVRGSHRDGPSSETLHKTRPFVSRSHGSFRQLRTCRNVDAGQYWAKTCREYLQQPGRGPFRLLAKL